MDLSYLTTLTSIEKVFYKAAYEFHLRTNPEATSDEAHATGVNEISRYKKIRENAVEHNTETRFYR